MHALQILALDALFAVGFISLVLVILLTIARYFGSGVALLVLISTIATTGVLAFGMVLIAKSDVPEPCTFGTCQTDTVIERLVTCDVCHQPAEYRNTAGTIDLVHVSDGTPVPSGTYSAG